MRESFVRLVRDTTGPPWLMASSAFSDVGVNPIDFPEAPALAIPIALKSAGLDIKDIARFEINEAFSVVVRIAEQALGISYDKINIDG